MTKINRNDLCPCGSGKKYKKCCLPLSQNKVKFSEHTKRMFGIASFAPPPPWSKQYEEYKKFFKKVIKPNVEKNDAKRRFQKAASNVISSLLNGADLLSDQNLRYFYQEFNDRLFNHGLWSFPTSFNIGEAFMEYNPALNCFDLLKEKNYLFAFEDYMEFVTSENCNDKYKDALSYFEEGTIYNFNNSDDLKNFTFKTKDNAEYVFGGISLIRHHDELNLIMTIGEITDTTIIDDEIRATFKWKQSKDPAKKKLKIDENRKLEAVRLNNIENLWHQIVMSRFDFSDFTQNVRYLLKDFGQNFICYTDDMSVFINDHGGWKNEELKEMLVNSTKELNLKSTLFEISKFMIFLPLYFNQNENRIDIERHPTRLLEYLEKDQSKDFKKIIDYKNSIRYRNVLSILKTKNMSPDILTAKAPGIKTELTGFWRKLKPNQIGVNKKGDLIHGKTWVEKKLTWLETYDQEAVTMYKKHQEEVFAGKNEGIIYVMRSAAHSKDIFKIGLTTRTSEIRSTELARTSGSPDKFLVIEEWYVCDCFSAEKEIHNKLSRFRINPKREFFQAPYDLMRKEITKIIEKYKKE